MQGESIVCYVWSGVSRLLFPPAVTVTTSRRFSSPDFDPEKYAPKIDRRSRESLIMTEHAFPGIIATRRFTDKRKMKFFKHQDHPTSSYGRDKQASID